MSLRLWKGWVNDMNDRQTILEMLESGRINAQEAQQLIDALDGRDARTKSGDVEGALPKKGGKKLRVYVKGMASGQKINVNVAIPVAIARVVDNLLENCIPNVAQEELQKQGINIKGIRLGEILDALGDDEDVVNANIESEKADLNVRVYVE